MSFEKNVRSIKMYSRGEIVNEFRVDFEIQLSFIFYIVG